MFSLILGHSVGHFAQVLVAQKTTPHQRLKHNIIYMTLST